MSADQITPEKEINLRPIPIIHDPSMGGDITPDDIAAWRRNWESNEAHGYRRNATLSKAFDIIESLRAEVQRLRDESRRSDAGQVEVPERVEQTIMHVPGESRGNCFAAVFAGLLQIPIESIPDFDGPDWRKQVNAFLRPYGLAWLQVGIDKEWLEDSGVSGMWHEVSGTTSRFDGKVRHSCAALDAEVAWDPHPSQSGFVHQNGAGIFVALQPWKMAHARLSPSPQPSADVVPIGRVRYFACFGPDGTTHFAVHPDGRAWKGDEIDGEIHWRAKETSTMVDGVAVPPDSADVVVVPMAEWYAFVTLEEKMRRDTAYLNLREQACLDALDALRSSTNHDAQDAGEGR